MVDDLPSADADTDAHDEAVAPGVETPVPPATEHGGAGHDGGAEPPPAPRARTLVVYRPRPALPVAVAGAVRRSLAGIARQPLGELARRPLVMAPAAAVVTLAARRLATTALRAAATREAVRRTVSGPGAAAGPTTVLVDVSVLVVHHWVGPGPGASATDALGPPW